MDYTVSDKTWGFVFAMKSFSPKMFILLATTVNVDADGDRKENLTSQGMPFLLCFRLQKMFPLSVSEMEKRQIQDFCPFAIIKNYLKVRGPAKNNGELFFVFSDSSPVKPMHMRSTLKLILRISGFDHTCYDTMSFRSGRASDLLKMGVSVETINQLGRWRSNAVFRYLR